ncbi:MAG: DNRLRE domain-containing protein [Candidatus Pacebacteria bacterium]|nr:DNRLRE domain-containing protein [Candidatus Paceibacterota bacterium]
MKPIKSRILSLLLILSLCLTPKPVRAKTRILATIKDTYVNSLHPEKTHGAAGSVSVSNKIARRLAYLWFENPKIPSGSALDRAILKFNIFEAPNAGLARLKIGRTSSDWNELHLDFNNQPGLDLSQIIEVEIDSHRGLKEIDITALAQEWIGDKTGNQGLFIHPAIPPNGGPETEFVFSFFSRESADEPPTVAIEYHFEGLPPANPSPTPTVSPQLTPPTEKTLPTPFLSKPVSGETSGFGKTGLNQDPSKSAGTEITLSFKQEIKKLNLKPLEIALGGMVLLSGISSGVFLVLAFVKKEKNTPEQNNPPATSQKKTPAED